MTKKSSSISKNFSVSDIKVSKGVILGCAAFVLLGVVDAIHCSEIEVLKNQVEFLENQIEQGQKTYVYDVNKVIAGTPSLIEMKKNYELQLADLNNQIDEANKKLEKMKDKAAKAEYSEVYLTSLKVKRDALIENYQTSVQNISDTVNSALLSVVDANGLNVVFDVKSIAVKTAKVIDITDEVLQNSTK